MLYRQLEYKGEVHKCEVPQSWSEVSFGTMHSLMKAQNDVQRFSALTGLNEDLLQFNGLTDFYIWLDHNLAWAKTPFEVNDTTPNLTWEFEEVSYELPLDINYESIGQYEDMKALVSGLIEEKDPVKLAEQYPMIVAIYLQPLIDGEYDFNKAKVISEKLLEYPCMQVNNTANFFLNKFLSLNKITPKCFQREGIMQKVKRLALATFIKPLVFIRHYTN